MPTKPTDDELMRRLEAGDYEASLTAIEARYRDRITGFVRSFLQDDHLAQDVTQEVFEKVFLKSHQYRPGTCFRAWLFEIARNQARSALRNRKQAPIPISSFATTAEEEPLDHLAISAGDRTPEEREFMAAFRDAVARLPEHYQYVFDLCANRGMDYRSAAQHLGVPVGTVAIRLMRARRRLFDALSQHFDRLRRPPACLA